MRMSLFSALGSTLSLLTSDNDNLAEIFRFSSDATRIL